MKTSNFNIQGMSDGALNALMTAIENEKSKRASQRETQRAIWIDHHIRQFNNTYDAVCHIRENLTIVAVYDEMEGTRIGTAYPINGDKYDYKVGVAVAFAKANGEDIPDYI